MLVTGASKIGDAVVRPVCGDSLGLPFEDDVFDGATVGFGVRNLSDLERGLAELGTPRIGKLLGLFYAASIVIGCLGIGNMF